MAVKAKKTGVSKSLYNVKGATLQEVWNDIIANGPKNNGQSVAGLTQCKLGGVASTKFKFEVKKKKDGCEAEAKLDAAQLNFSCSIKLPKLTSAGSLSADAKKAWVAFVTGVAKHELEHVKEFEKECNAMAKDLEQITAKGTAKGSDKKAETQAKKAAQAEWEKVYKKEFTQTKNTKRLTANAKALDSKTGHGPTLDLSIP